MKRQTANPDSPHRGGVSSADSNEVAARRCNSAIRILGYIHLGLAFGAFIAGTVFAAATTDGSISACNRNDQAATVLSSAAYFAMAAAFGSLAINRLRSSPFISPALDLFTICGIASASSIASVVAYVEGFHPVLALVPLAVGITSIAMAVHARSASHAP